jgi:hypothetical protein
MVSYTIPHLRIITDLYFVISALINEKLLVCIIQFTP